MKLSHVLIIPQKLVIDVYMKTIFYVIFPVIAFVAILSNALFGHLLYDSPYDQDINKYSVYVHLKPEWKSYPGNILFEITNVWSNPNPQTNTFNYDPSVKASLVTDHNYNQLQFQNQKPFVELKHEFSDCESSWKPILYRYAIDSVRNNLEYMQGNQLNNDPYVQIFPDIQNEKHSLEEHQELIENGFVQFIPICTAKQITSYDFSVSTNDDNTSFDVYFVDSKQQLGNYLKEDSFDFYSHDECFAINHQSFSGTCSNVSSNGGILIVLTDNLELSLTKIRINIHEI